MLGTLLRDLIRRQRTAQALSQRLGTLSRREREVLLLLVDGCDRQTIADRLVVSKHTARSHVHNVLSKLGARSTVEAAALVIEHGLYDQVRGAEGG
jgi:DNA-binding NarL/FixJ family response regulator